MQTSSRPAMPGGWRLGRVRPTSSSRNPLGVLQASFVILLTAAALTVRLGAGVRAPGAAFDNPGPEPIIARQQSRRPAAWCSNSRLGREPGPGTSS